jgi:hypothetical protein
MQKTHVIGVVKAYMGYSKEYGPQEGACLVFAHNAREALKLARPVLIGWFDLGYIDARVRLLKDSDHLFRTEADPAKLERDEPHVIESPKVCRSCEMWGNKLDEHGLCEYCEP